RAVLLCLERRKLVVEPAGAAAVAALLEHPGVFEPPIVAVLSGGNVDPLLLLQIIQHGMTAAGRYLSLRLRVPDRPGSLARVLSLVGELGANVLDVEHSRISGRLAMGEVESALKLETRGADPDAAERPVTADAPRHRVVVGVDRVGVVRGCRDGPVPARWPRTGL